MAVVKINTEDLERIHSQLLYNLYDQDLPDERHAEVESLSKLVSIMLGQEPAQPLQRQAPVTEPEPAGEADEGTESGPDPEA